MKVAFYAPMKAPTHPIPSGDRRLARLLIQALELAGHEVELAARLRSWEGSGDTHRQKRLKNLGEKLAQRLIRNLKRRPLEERPHAWITYHLYHKAPDWIGPRISHALDIPYLLIEASHAPSKSRGPWAEGAAASCAAIRHASAIVCLNPADEPCLLPLLDSPQRLRHLPPFLDCEPYTPPADRAELREQLARRENISDQQPWLLAVAMMRRGDKLASYHQLAEAVDQLAHPDWALLLIGDGAARKEVERSFPRRLLPRIRFLGGIFNHDELRNWLWSADLMTWPAVNEAFGMALLEAQAAGLPVVAGTTRGVAELIQHDRTGFLVPMEDATAFARAIDTLLAEPARRQAMARTALKQTRARHDLSVAAVFLDELLHSVVVNQV